MSYYCSLMKDDLIWNNHSWHLLQQTVQAKSAETSTFPPASSHAIERASLYWSLAYIYQMTISHFLKEVKLEAGCIQLIQMEVPLWQWTSEQEVSIWKCCSAGGFFKIFCMWMCLPDFKIWTFSIPILSPFITHQYTNFIQENTQFC